ncbi:1-phosphofructokinase family hexose kinase [Emticicia sp. BO119]|uniref:1-phosphofructokinase family hexose kinase n=1 Tax=Emticicia sp. BO119 TaxID=2757768 RepID=UPI0015EFF759|nr:1-phosphofructokinase family hexose kinase [Emticicia sp. BO119]MBA4848830.1 1-phosphofructokinase family hexose kinase [Emticicia sp. BO119]
MKKHNNKIVTLTVSPAVDKSTKFAGLVAEQKIRCETPHFDAGGGGINVSKAIARLGGNSLAVFTVGGATGELLQDLVKKEGVDFQAIRTESWTRESFIAVDTITNAQYRFGMPGPAITDMEAKEILKTVEEAKPGFLVASGSLAPGLGDDFYEKVAAVSRKVGTKLIVDTSGAALEKAVNEGVFLLKPNVGELARLVKAESLEINEVDDAAREIISHGKCEVVVVSLGPQGAVLVTKDICEHIPAPPVQKKSTVGAGDSMVGGMVWALSEGKDYHEMLRWGVACGSAATMNEGTQLFTKQDAHKLFKWLNTYGEKYQIHNL